MAVAGEAGLLLLGWALGRWLDVSPLQQLYPNIRSFLWGVVATVPLLLGLAGIIRSRQPAFRRLVDRVVEHLGPVLSRCSWAELFLLATLAGIAEELLFRGVLQASLARVIPGAGALLVASTAFGLAHLATSTYALLAGIMGLYLGGLFLLQGSLTAPIVTHALYDLVALLWVAQRHRTSRPAG